MTYSDDTQRHRNGRFSHGPGYRARAAPQKKLILETSQWSNSL